jgi:hypothetical protein
MTTEQAQTNREFKKLTDIFDDLNTLPYDAADVGICANKEFWEARDKAKRHLANYLKEPHLIDRLNKKQIVKLMQLCSTHMPIEPFKVLILF